MMNDNQDIKECRICLDGECNVDTGKLFRPCLCKGTQAYIHEGCLNSWRQNTNNASQVYECPTCHYKYKFSRIWYAHLLTNNITVILVTLLTIIFSVILVGFFIRNIIFLLVGIKLSKNVFALSTKIVWWSMLTIGFIAMLLIIVKENDDLNLNNIIDINYFDGLFTVFGYMFSLTGFCIFVKNIYGLVQSYMLSILTRLGEQIMEVSN
jgi:magnesium-transporting ATPase (P-type)